MKKELSQQQMLEIQGGGVPFWTQLLKEQVKTTTNVTKAAWESDLWRKENPGFPRCNPVKPLPPIQTMRYPSDSDSDKITF
jgi:Serine endopeptidase inhibitors